MVMYQITVNCGYEKVISCGCQSVRKSLDNLLQYRKERVILLDHSTSLWRAAGPPATSWWHNSKKWKGTSTPTIGYSRNCYPESIMFKELVGLFCCLCVSFNLPQLYLLRSVISCIRMYCIEVSFCGNKQIQNVIKIWEKICHHEEKCEGDWQSSLENKEGNLYLFLSMMDSTCVIAKHQCKWQVALMISTPKPNIYCRCFRFNTLVHSITALEIWCNTVFEKNIPSVYRDITSM